MNKNQPAPKANNDVNKSTGTLPSFSENKASQNKAITVRSNIPENEPHKNKPTYEKMGSDKTPTSHQ